MSRYRIKEVLRESGDYVYFIQKKLKLLNIWVTYASDIWGNSLSEWRLFMFYGTFYHNFEDADTIIKNMIKRDKSIKFKSTSIVKEYE